MSKEIMAVARNLSMLPGDGGKVVPMVEVIICVSEPVFTVDAAGQMIRQRTTDTLRFHVGAKALRQVIGQLTGFADEADELEEEYGPTKGEGK